MQSEPVGGAAAAGAAGEPLQWGRIWLAKVLAILGESERLRGMHGALVLTYTSTYTMTSQVAPRVKAN